MGLSTFNNIMAWFVFKTIELFVISIFWGLIVRGLYFPDQNFAYVWLLFFWTAIFFLLLGITVQSFFSTLKQGTFFCITIIVIFYLISQSADAIEEPSKTVQKRYAISPIAGLQLAAKV